MSPTLLVRYGELALKSPPVRREFERTLQRNILEQFRAEGTVCRIRGDRGHLYVDADDLDAAARRVCRVFGVTSVSAVTEVTTDVEAIARGVLTIADGALLPGRSFAVRARRTGQHAFTSQELARELGSRILQAWGDRGLRVDLDTPEVEVHVEVRGPRTYLSLDRRPGPGGLPLGVAGRVVALVDGTRGALGAYLMMKRGCRCAVVATGPGEPLARDVLRRFDPSARIEASGPVPEDALHALVEAIGADAVVLPLGVEEYPQELARWGDRVVFSPTVGFDPGEVDRRWQAVAALAA